MNKIKIKTAIVSVSDKTELKKLADYFFENNIKSQYQVEEPFKI